MRTLYAIIGMNTPSMPTMISPTTKTLPCSAAAAGFDVAPLSYAVFAITGNGSTGRI